MSPEPLLVLAGCVVLAALLVLLARRNRRRPRVQLPPAPTRPPHIDVSPVAAAVHPALHPSTQPTPPPAAFPTANAIRVGADPAFRARPGWTPPQPNRAAPSPADSTTTVMPPVAPPYGRHAAKVPGGGNVIELLRANDAIRLAR